MSPKVTCWESPCDDVDGVERAEDGHHGLVPTRALEWPLQIRSASFWRSLERPREGLIRKYLCQENQGPGAKPGSSHDAAFTRSLWRGFNPTIRTGRGSCKACVQIVVKRPIEIVRRKAEGGSIHVLKVTTSHPGDTLREIVARRPAPSGTR